MKSNDKYLGKIKDISDQQSVIERSSVQIQAALQIGHAQNSDTIQCKLLETLEDLKEPFSHLEALSENTNKILEDVERDKILDWICDIPHIKHHKAVHGNVLRGTGEWLLRSEELLKWQDLSSSQMMWLHGIIGSGKSRLVYVIFCFRLLL